MYPAPKKPRLDRKMSCDKIQENELLVDKYKPLFSKDIVGQQAKIKNLREFLKEWDKRYLSKTLQKGAHKCVLLAGPPGVGKTSAAHLIAKELGFEVVELNSSNNRNKKSVSENFGDILNTTSIVNKNDGISKTRKRVLIMDELDGADQGGITEFMKLIKSTKIPIIAICNDKNIKNIRSLAAHCLVLIFDKPKLQQITAAMMSICWKENFKIQPVKLSEIIVGSGHDMRQVLHSLSMLMAGKSDNERLNIEVDQSEQKTNVKLKTSVKIGPWEVCKIVFNKDLNRSMTIQDKANLYDRNLAGMFVQQNYLAVRPVAAGGDKLKTMQLVSMAADSISEGDVIEKEVSSSMSWSLSASAAVFCSVLPGEYMSGDNVLSFLQLTFYHGLFRCFY